MQLARLNAIRDFDDPAEREIFENQLKEKMGKRDE